MGCLYLRVCCYSNISARAIALGAVKINSQERIGQGPGGSYGGVEGFGGEGEVQVLPDCRWRDACAHANLGRRHGSSGL